MSGAARTASYVAVAIVEGQTAEEVARSANDWLDHNLTREVRSMQLSATPNGFAILITYARERRVRRS